MKLLSLLGLLSLPVLACEVRLPEQILILGSISGIDEALSGDCPQGLSQDLGEFLSSAEGRISALQLKEVLSQRGHTTVSVQPERVLVRQLPTLLRERLSLPTGVQVASTTALSGSGMIPLKKDDRVEVDCTSCLYGRAQDVKIRINGFDGSLRAVIAKADFRRMARAFRVKANLASFAEVKAHEVLEEAFVESVPHTDLITDLEEVKFYRTNKPIKAGSLLKMSDLNPLNLVRAGTKTEVILENSMVRIKTHGTARGNGGRGDTVEIFHQQKNKKYLGKVIDHNKVLVEL